MRIKVWKASLLFCFVLFLLSLSPEQPSFYRLNDLTIPSDAKAIVYGMSGEGRNLLAYQFGRGENVMVLGFCIHGYEDNWDRDAEALIYTAGQLMDQLSHSDSILQEYDWTVYVLPCINPDGFYSGYSPDGPGRCTTRYYDSDGNLIKGGLDLNRSFPHQWEQFVDSRYYNGSAPLAAEEAKALAQFIQDVQGSGENILIDTHGWMAQIIPSDGENVIYQIFKQMFPGNTYADLDSGKGYFAAYAADLGYHACLFEFPDGIYNLEQFKRSGCCERFNNSIIKLLALFSQSLYFDSTESRSCGEGIRAH